MIGTLPGEIVAHHLAPDADHQGVIGRLARRGQQLADDHRLAARTQAKARIAGRLFGRRHRTGQGGPLVEQLQKFTVNGIQSPSDLVQ